MQLPAAATASPADCGPAPSLPAGSQLPVGTRAHDVAPPGLKAKSRSNGESSVPEGRLLPGVGIKGVGSKGAGGMRSDQAANGRPPMVADPLEDAPPGFSRPQGKPSRAIKAVIGGSDDDDPPPGFSSKPQRAPVGAAPERERRPRQPLLQASLYQVRKSISGTLHAVVMSVHMLTVSIFLYLCMDTHQGINKFKSGVVFKTLTGVCTLGPEL